MGEGGWMRVWVGEGGWLRVGGWVRVGIRRTFVCVDSPCLSEGCPLGGVRATSAVVEKGRRPLTCVA